ncbi:uncharacterized protein LOC114540422 [Dendronephthya gigantea]|uniref:uncharacterized protein LOC114540422 n=1 Tax=Dendronephthya gigantea TaxID=151771 RepID=UPI00106A96DD|nr:uncharacterized protein LOC114540422 [Dendronephthya gigantea]
MWSSKAAKSQKRFSSTSRCEKKNDSSCKVKSLGMDKQLAHNKHLRDSGDFDCVLMYPDFGLVNTIPGTSQPFTVERYKEAIGRPYNRVNLYLCKVSDFEIANDIEILKMNLCDHTAPQQLTLRTGIATKLC